MSFLQSFHAMKLCEITIFYAVSFIPEVPLYRCSTLYPFWKNKRDGELAKFHIWSAVLRKNSLTQELSYKFYENPQKSLCIEYLWVSASVIPFVNTKRFLKALIKSFDVLERSAKTVFAYLNRIIDIKDKMR